MELSDFGVFACGWVGGWVGGGCNGVCLPVGLTSVHSHVVERLARGAACACGVWHLLELWYPAAEDTVLLYYRGL